MPNQSFFIAIDESGDQGFRFGCETASTEWFVLSAVVSLNRHEPELARVLKGLKREAGWTERKPIHFKRLKTNDKRRIAVERVASCRHLLKVASVLVYKPTYSYDLVGNQGRVVYPNGVQHEYVYDSLDRLTSLPITSGGLLDRHNYTVAPTGHRLSTTRLNGRTSSYGYLCICQLES